MNPHTQTHSLITVVDEVDFATMKVNVYGTIDENIGGLTVDEIRGAITDTMVANDRVSLAMLQSVHAKRIHDAIAAAIADGCTVSVMPCADPTKRAVFNDTNVPALGMGFGMTVVNVRLTRDVISEGYAMKEAREKLAEFKLEPVDHTSYRDMALESDITAGKVATGQYFQK